MLLFLAIAFPPLAFLLMGKPAQAVLCALLMATCFGWIPAAIWAGLVVVDRRAAQRDRKLLESVARPRGPAPGPSMSPLAAVLAIVALCLPLLAAGALAFWMYFPAPEPDLAPARATLPTTGPLPGNRVAEPMSPAPDPGPAPAPRQPALPALAYDARKSVYPILAAARLAVVAETDLRYPDALSGRAGGAYQDRRALALESLRSARYAEIARRHQVPETDVPGILDEGDRNGWPVGTVHVRNPEPGEVVRAPAPIVPEATLSSRELAAPRSDEQAAILLGFAANHERDGRRRQALASYREVLARYPETAEARTAKAAIARIGDW